MQQLSIQLSGHCFQNVSFSLAFPFSLVAGVPVGKCRTDYDCPADESCVNSQCVNPCLLRGACGENALCQVVLHKVRCSCPQCFRGRANLKCSPDPSCEPRNPYLESSVTCDDDDDCPIDSTCQDGQCVDACAGFSCDKNKICEVRNHQPVCVCRHGFLVNEIGEFVCSPGAVECRSDQECPSHQACVNFKCDDPCRINKPCGDGKICDVVDHKPVCICTKDCSAEVFICLRDEGCPPNEACKGYQCRNPCDGHPCPQDTPCVVENHRPVCKFCPPNFVPDTRYGCVPGKNPACLCHFSSIQPVLLPPGHISPISKHATTLLLTLKALI